MKKYTSEELFNNLIKQFQQSVLIYLGKIKNPQNNKFEKNMPMAEYFIMMLYMLQEKTINNLSRNEENSLKYIISHLNKIYKEENTG